MKPPTDAAIPMVGAIRGDPPPLDLAGATDCEMDGRRSNDHWAIARIGEATVVDASVSIDLPEGLTSHPAPRFLLAVARGMGDSAAAELAAATALRTLVHEAIHRTAFARRFDSPLDDEGEALLREAVALSGVAIEAAARGVPQPIHLQSTLTCALVAYPNLVLAHAGDGRAFLLRSGELRQLTVDHTTTEPAVPREPSRGAKDAAATREVLWNALGANAHHRTDVIHRQIQPADRVLLCSSGLLRRLTNDRVRDLLASAATAVEACANLVDAASAGGDTDGVAAVVAIVSPSSAAPPPLALHAALAPAAQPPETEPCLQDLAPSLPGRLDPEPV